MTESYVENIWANNPNTASTTAADGALTGAHMAAAAAASANPAPAALQLALDPTMQMFPRLIDRQTMNLFGFPAIMPQTKGGKEGERAFATAAVVYGTTPSLNLFATSRQLEPVGSRGSSEYLGYEKATIFENSTASGVCVLALPGDIY